MAYDAAPGAESAPGKPNKTPPADKNKPSQEAIQKARAGFEARLEKELRDSREDLVDRVHGYAIEEDKLRQKHPGETAFIETSEAIATQILRTLQAEAKATKDPLTDLLNRRSFEEMLEKLQAESKVMQNSGHRRATDIPEILTKAPFYLLMVDIDHFKDINDTHGHFAGDEVLQEIAKRLQKNLRRGDLVSRFGGEEFLIAVLSINGDAPNVAEKLRAAIESELFTYHDKQGQEQKIKVTVSIGIGPYNQGTEKMKTDADKALYDAKNAGRNLVCGYDEDGKPTTYVKDNGDVEVRAAA